MAIAIALRGFNDLGRSLTPIFLSMAHFLSDFLLIYRVEVYNKFFAKRSIEFHSLDLSV